MAQCSGSHISEMQLFHELKQRFPNVPDRLVTHCIKQTRGDRAACTCILEAEALLSNHKVSGRRMSSEERGESPARGRTPSPQAPTDRPRGRTPSPQDKPRGPPTSRVTFMPDIKSFDRNTQLLIQDQLARKKKLEIELEKDRLELQKMEETAKQLEKELQEYSKKVWSLTREIEILRKECHRFTSEVDNSSNSGVPLGETRPEYYGVHIGQRGPHRQNTSRHSERRRGIEEEGDHWCCSMCTFQNHPLLKNCEECSMPRFPPDGGETQNIHIHVTHHNYPSCKVVHSWVI